MVAPEFDISLLGPLLSIIIIDLVLSGDNAVVIGMAARGLNDRHRKWAIIGGVFGAVALRVFFAVVFAILLFETELAGVRLVGGVLLLWIAWKLMIEPPTEEDEEEGREADQLWEAIAIIIAADAVMSMDNMLAVAGASQGELWLIGLGLALSIPMLFVGAAVISRVLNRFPWLVWIGGGIIAYVGGDLIAEEPLLHGIFTSHALQLGFAVFTLVVITGASYLYAHHEGSLLPSGTG